MNKYFAYTRVSTTRQGEHGVSLQEQREAIERYAQKSGLHIVRWFEEQETAAKRGRRMFSEMMRLLHAKHGSGVIIHKIDRSARNLRDWADLGELIDCGVDVHFANESLDLSSRGGRLSADIQAVVAADYIRNLREELKKGFYGRLKQGILPMPAPVGYLDAGGGKPKVIDPQRGPLMRLAFELYASGRFNQHTLAAEMQARGLRSKRGRVVTANRFSYLLHNTFYMGLITVKKTGQTFAGKHEPLVSQSLFQRVQDILHGRINTRPLKHDFLFRRRVACQPCGYNLIGETHKSHVYYRCQTPNCHSSLVREEVIEQAVLDAFGHLCFSAEEKTYLAQQMARLADEAQSHEQEIQKALELRRGQIDDRLNRLTDAYIDRLLSQGDYEERKRALLMERTEIEGQLRDLARGSGESLTEFLELANAAYSTYKTGTTEEKRRLLDAVTSNRSVDGKSAMVTLKIPFNTIADRAKNQTGGTTLAVPRIWEHLLERLISEHRLLPTGTLPAFVASPRGISELPAA